MSKQRVQKQEYCYNDRALVGLGFSMTLPLLGLIFSILGLSKAKKMGGQGKDWAMWGICISIAMMILYGAYTIKFVNETFKLFNEELTSSLTRLL